MHSGAGRLTEMLYNLFREQDDAEVDVIPTLGQHVPHTADENRRMFGSIPQFADSSLTIGAADACRSARYSGRFVDQASGGQADWAIPIELNRMLMEQPWDLVINIGHVVPHEVLGFANHNKNYFIGLGGKESICTVAHDGRGVRDRKQPRQPDHAAPRACFNRAEDEFLVSLPDLYVQIVMARIETATGIWSTPGVYVGDDLETYLAAARHSRGRISRCFEEPIEQIVCVMQGDEFVSTWVANKAIYRTRMAIGRRRRADHHRPGTEAVRRTAGSRSADPQIWLRRHAARLQQYRENADMQDLAHATAHLIHGSTEGRFTVTYAPGDMTKEEIESVNYQYADIGETVRRYQPQHRKEGWNLTDDGERFFYIPTPSAGLWATRKKLFDRPGGFGEG